MRFNSGRFDAHVANIGQQLLWRRSYSCACVQEGSGAPDPKHALCHGKGRLWDQPIQTVAGVPKQDSYNKMIAAGLWEQGDMMLTIPQTSPMWDYSGRGDRITMLNATDVFSLPLKRGAPSERLLFTPVAIQRVFWLHPTTRMPVEGGIPTFDANGVPSWSANAPPAGVTYSITGTRHPEYFIWDHMPSDRNEHAGMRLPKRVQLRKWDLYGR